jgi:hypothetical protein
MQLKIKLTLNIGIKFTTRVSCGQNYKQHEGKVEVFAMRNKLSITLWRRVWEWRYSFTILDLGI